MEGAEGVTANSCGSGDIKPRNAADKTGILPSLFGTPAAGRSRQRCEMPTCQQRLGTPPLTCFLFAMLLLLSLLLLPQVPR